MPRIDRTPIPDSVMREAAEQIIAAKLCGARTGPVWKLGGEVCVCIEDAGHVERQDGTFGADHLCSCGAWFVPTVARGGT